MCTHLTTTSTVHGSGNRGSGWIPVKEVSVGYDHATQGDAEHALLLDFTNYKLGVHARVAVELDLASGRTLLAMLQTIITQADASGLHEH